MTKKEYERATDNLREFVKRDIKASIAAKKRYGEGSKEELAWEFAIETADIILKKMDALLPRRAD